MQNIDDFIDQLLEEKGITNLDQDVLASLKEEMKTRLTNEVNRACIMELSEDKAAELNEHLDDPNFTNEMFGDFLKNSGVDIENVATATLLRFRDFYLGTEA